MLQTVRGDVAHLNRYAQSESLGAPGNAGLDQARRRWRAQVWLRVREGRPVGPQLISAVPTFSSFADVQFLIAVGVQRDSADLVHLRGLFLRTDLDRAALLGQLYGPVFTPSASPEIPARPAPIGPGLRASDSVRPCPGFAACCPAFLRDAPLRCRLL